MTPNEVFGRFAKDIAADPLVSTQLAAWSDARSRWRASWSGRGAASAIAVFRSAVPGLLSGAGDQGTHPVAEHAPELGSWRAAWQKASVAEQNELAELFLRAVALIERNAESLDEACGMMAGSSAGHGLPLAALSPAASSLHPSRLLVVCDAWLSVFHEGGEPPNSISAYPLLNAHGLRWLSTAEGGVLPPVLAGSERSDRMAVFCTWLTRTNRTSTAEAKFDVTQKKYKDWPPMW
jgi:hypothetical protein